MEENKQEKYLRISKEIVNYVGGEDKRRVYRWEPIAINIWSRFSK